MKMTVIRSLKNKMLVRAESSEDPNQTVLLSCLIWVCTAGLNIFNQDYLFDFFLHFTRTEMQVNVPSGHREATNILN